MSTLAVARFVSEPPLTPDSAEGRELAEQELAKAKYTDSTNLIERFFRWLGNQFDRLSQIGAGASDPWGFVPLLVVLFLVAVIALAIWQVSRRNQIARQMGAKRETLFDDARTSTELFASAQQAKVAGNLDTALVDAYRGVIRALDERRYIDVVPGMTALESARLGSFAVGHDALFGAGANWFNRVYYSSYRATPESVADVDALADVVLALPAKPLEKQSAVVT